MWEVGGWGGAEGPNPDSCFRLVGLLYRHMQVDIVLCLGVEADGPGENRAERFLQRRLTSHHAGDTNLNF